MARFAATAISVTAMSDPLDSAQRPRHGRMQTYTGFNQHVLRLESHSGPHVRARQSWEQDMCELEVVEADVDRGDISPLIPKDVM